MPRVRVIHWRAIEAQPLIEACRAAGFDVEYLEGDGGAICRAIRAKPPDVLVIDLTRLPSHGKEVAVWARNTKSTRGIPIVFTGGEAVKVAAIRTWLPDGEFCDVAKVASAIKGVSRREKSTAEKPGIVAGSAVCCVEPPREFPELSVEFREEEIAPVTLWFTHSREGLLENLRRMRAMAPRTKLWLLWRKGSKGFAGAGLTQNTVREMTREVGLVDYKICSVDAKWSAMLFTRKKA